jgi:hypothetical protein
LQSRHGTSSLLVGSEDERGREKVTLIMVFLVLGASAIFGPPPAYAYRPFVSTDAAVVAQHETEIELGLLTVSRSQGSYEVLSPSLRLNYGLWKNWELVAEFENQVYSQDTDRNWQVKNPGLFLKGILIEGLLQNKPGPGLATEFGILPPSTVKGESRMGAAGAFILSNNIKEWVYHLNLGLELDRVRQEPRLAWGVILEYPVTRSFRLVGELNGFATARDAPENSGLIGFIWLYRKIAFDFGIRFGLSRLAPDQAVTTGVTFAF